MQKQWLARSKKTSDRRKPVDGGTIHGKREGREDEEEQEEWPLGGTEAAVERGPGCREVGGILDEAVAVGGPGGGVVVGAAAVAS